MNGVEKMKRKSSQVIELHKFNNNSTPFGIVIPKRKNLKARDVLSIHSQLIRNFISGNIDSQEAKDLSYLCTNYLSALQLVDYEKRIEDLEKIANNKNE